MMNKYRTHNCYALGERDVGKVAKISGWLHRKRDHGNLLFVDIRDHFGITQCVIENKNKFFKTLEKLKPESVLTIEGTIHKREKGTENLELSTGKIEIQIQNLIILSESKELPMPVFGEQDYPEEIRLKYRFLDLRKKDMHQIMILRSNILSFIREQMIKNNFLEFQTPILTASSPEGARDFLVPSRVHKGKFYALPQAPQQFKQMIMIAGYDRYFQIAPCFRDEDGRADRSPGEHYQLDMEMSFVEQDDIFKVVEPIFFDLFKKFANKSNINKYPFPRITYKESLEKYGTDKPDLRNPLIIEDFTNSINNEGVTLEIFKNNIKNGGVVKGIKVSKISDKPRSFFDNLNKWAINEGAKGLAYIIFEEKEKKISGKGPISKYFSDNSLNSLIKNYKVVSGDAIFFISNKNDEAIKFSGLVRKKLAEELNLIKNNEFKFCWIIDFPMYQYDEKEKKIDFSHNPFSMPQIDMSEFDNTDPLKILAYQYDLVCNGYELSSGAIRNHLPDYMYKVFMKVGYKKDEIDKKFSGMIKALSFGAPPHGGMAPGIDRIVMLLAKQKNIREVTLFPLTQNGQDLLMGAPSEIGKSQLKDLGIKLDLKKSD